MIVETGHFALALALAISLVQVVMPIWAARSGDPALRQIASQAALGAFACVLFAFAALTYAHVTSDFSVQNVVENSHTQKPLIYKISGVWGNHEGSMLLWVLILTLFGACVAAAKNSVPPRLRASTLGVQGLITFVFVLFIITTSNPFTRVIPAPLEGNDLNPLLQDPGLAIHPPLLYVGYVGFSISFAFAVAALIDGRIDAVWARAVRPWTLAAWCFLTLGIAMGSYWAYYELGWGGWWFWDPVENASLMPWIAGTALLHSTVVMEKRDALKVWTVLLAILTFSLSLIGTFLVRSGVITSVHSFATDPTRGVFILAILVLFIGGSLTLFAWRAPLLRQGGLFAPISREGSLVLNNLFLVAACATVLVGTLYPLVLEMLTGEKITVGPPFFNSTFVPLAIPLLLIVPMGQSLAWKRGDVLAAAQRLFAALAVALVVGFGVLALTWGGPVMAPVGIGLGAYLLIGSALEIVTRARGYGASRARSLGQIGRRAVGLPRSAWGTAIAHAGVGVVVLGIAAQGWATEGLATLKAGQSLATGPYVATLDRVAPRKGPNYEEAAAYLTIRTRGGDEVGQVETGKRFYPSRKMAVTESGLLTVGASQVYASLGEIGQDGGVGLRLYYKPLVLLIWLGAVVMAVGGGLSLTDRRMRVGVPAKAKARPLPVAVPAE
ncbi:cytochrome c-type biogenesis protein CcmF [Methylobacterium sp. PvP062]|jgi:cytochrome c-type biogenesis protein CcmF|uniref:Cytochrome c-type biogenesis protein CcmF n=2 Tax=Methylobacterium radiotolerans TaxID=31998 RepID=B1LU07_METRJ|nr:MULTISPECIES: heme lyase CcmF/NrfE family subunit [Methylobacterium]MCX7334534.1 heme lyase CcmF/NrfE family subunit [Hyphomicrobiales bacterium]GAN48210.1 c-type cytochrome biogenesis protein CcmF [Methylobacterium sp. ME121]ACB26951.1 cytochrome c-type biogenesis protein CcmF [Methylobacterium radiotolerans JCM 2831]MBN6821393.1 heme lyase CcmF/NrfE family subunit [Methylobacterium organophilum]MBP2491682.1 cytochrome c-type biogenesis protein CcmF [Methylobacterium sp. PvP105]